MKHWTQASTSDFAYNISLDFFTQLDDLIQERGLSRKELSENLNVTPSAVSQTLNNPPENPHLETLVQYARQLGSKVAIVLYDDDDPDNDKGPIYSGVFGKSWQAMGCPRDLSPFAANENLALRDLHIVRMDKPPVTNFEFGKATDQLVSIEELKKIPAQAANIGGKSEDQKAYAS